jgi:periplasmic protein TonB
MKITAAIVLLVAFLSPALLAQEDDKDERSAPAYLRPISVPPAAAEKLLIHRVDPIWKHHDMEARISCTIVLRITISKTGYVENARVISGPAMAQQAALDSVRHWEYKPYIVNGKPVEFSTRVSIAMSNY